MSRVTRPAPRRGWARLAALVAGGLLVTLAGTVAQAEEPRVSNISIVVADNSANLDPGNNARPGNVDPGGNSDPATTGTTTAAGQQGDTAEGILHVSGLGTGYVASVDPTRGVLQVQFMVRNAYTEPVGGRAEVWAEHWLGANLGTPVQVIVDPIPPGEGRLVTAQVEGIGQWALVKAGATFTPEVDIEGEALGAVTRETWTFFVPWFLLVVAAVGAATRWYQLHRRSRPRALAGAAA